jgi:hypothetical protein
VSKLPFLNPLQSGPLVGMDKKKSVRREYLGPATQTSIGDFVGKSSHCWHTHRCGPMHSPHNVHSHCPPLNSFAHVWQRVPSRFRVPPCPCQHIDCAPFILKIEKRLGVATITPSLPSLAEPPPLPMERRINPAFFKQGAAAQSGKASGIAGVMKRARQSGRLQMSSQGLKAIPPEVFMLDETVTEDEKCVLHCICAALSLCCIESVLHCVCAALSLCCIEPICVCSCVAVWRCGGVAAWASGERGVLRNSSGFGPGSP